MAAPTAVPVPAPTQTAAPVLAPIAPLPEEKKPFVHPAHRGFQAEIKDYADPIQLACAIMQPEMIQLGPNTLELLVEAQAFNQHQTVLTYNMFCAGWLWSYIQMIMAGICPGGEPQLYDRYVLKRCSMLQARTGNGAQTYYIAPSNILPMWVKFVDLYIRTHRGVLNVPDEIKARVQRALQVAFDKDTNSYVFSFYF